MLALLRNGMVEREVRRKVLIRSRMHSGSGWVDCCIHNMSSQGLMVAADDPPVVGAYVDIRRGTHVIIGRVRWRKDRFFGVRAQDRLPIDAIINEPRLAQRPTAAAVDGADRRAASRLSAEAAMARRIERNRWLSSSFQFGLLALAGVTGAAIAGHEVYQMLSRPAAAVTRALGPR
jgi:hypothetical protein